MKTSKSGIKIIDDLRVTIYQDDRGRYLEVISEMPRTQRHQIEILRQAVQTMLKKKPIIADGQEQQ